nr:beta-propeller fold lactonase family protein [uncultured Cohaesibacter sp.]
MKRKILTCQSGALDVRIFEIDCEQWSVKALERQPLEAVAGKSAAMPAVLAGDMVYLAFRGENPALLSLRLNEERTGLEMVGKLDIAESCPYLSISANGRFLLAAGGSNSLAVRIGANGILSEVTAREPLGALAHCLRQCHGMVYGTACRDDLLRQYRLDDVSGRLEEVACLAFAAGSGPRHIVAAPEGDCLFVITENGGTVVPVGIAAGQMALRENGAIALGSSEGKMWAGDLVISGDGSRLFASERAADRLVALGRKPGEGGLFVIDTIASPEHVRSMHLSPDDGWLVAMGNFGARGSIYAIDDAGRLTHKADFDTGDGPSWVLGLD